MASNQGVGGSSPSECTIFIKDLALICVIKTNYAGKDTSWIRLQIIIETARLSELELGEYCRKKGIYTHDIQVRKDGIIQNFSGQKADNLEEKKQAKKDKDRIKSLEKELRRKDKALAETAALLGLRKKLQAFYGEGSEED